MEIVLALVLGTVGVVLLLAGINRSGGSLLDSVFGAGTTGGTKTPAAATPKATTPGGAASGGPGRRAI